MEHYSRFLEYEKSYSVTRDIMPYHQDHAEIPILAVSFYLAFIFYVPKIVARFGPWDKQLKPLFAVWNLSLSIFSIIGVSRVVPRLLNKIQSEGFHESVCSGSEWYSEGDSGLWMTLFIYSKIPELGDTIFMVLRGKPVIFLHWFHHVTVLLYCWHAFHMMIGGGVWFAAMNYSVHSVMYFYFFCTNVGLYKMVAPFAMSITICQILQMLGGLAVLMHVALNIDNGTCPGDRANYKLGLFMYFSYFCLFALLFVDKYLMKGSNTEKKTKGAAAREEGCLSGSENIEASGFFHFEEKKKEHGKKE